MSTFAAWIVSFGTIWGIPGIFGFLVWELTANWRLYAANRRPTLGPVLVGSHGETMGRLPAPGFHSGTLPKRYAKLRRAERRRGPAENGRPSTNISAIRHVELWIRRFIEREFLELFAESRCWQGPPVALDDVRVGDQFVHLSLGCPELADEPLRVAVESQSGWLLAGVASPGWLERLAPSAAQMWSP